MTYNEWRDELKSNLLCVPESERRRVLDYYAEAYADRRDAGYTEREIIEDFGAPYDAAQRILGENRSSSPYEEDYEEPRSRRDARRQEREERERRREEERLRADRERRKNDRRIPRDGDDFEYCQDSSHRYEEQSEKQTSSDFTWVFVILCIVFCVPIFGLIMSMVGVTIGLCVSPFAVLISGIAKAGHGIGLLVGGNLAGGLCELGTGVIIFGVGVALIPLFIKLVKLMWDLFGKLFKWLKSLFSGKEKS